MSIGSNTLKRSIIGNGRVLSVATRLLATAVATFYLSAPAQGQGGVTILVNGQGLSSLQYGGSQFLGNGDFRVNGVLMQDGSNTPFYADLTATVTMDTVHQTLTRSYGWGSVTVNYAVSGNKLTLSMSTTNTSVHTIQGLFFEPLALKFPARVQEFDGVDPMLSDNIGGPSVMSMSYGSGVMVLANEDPVKPLSIGFPWTWDAPANTFFPLRVNTNHDGMYPSFFPTINRPILPGGSDQFQVSLRFGPPGSTVNTLATDVYSRFSAAFPQVLNWPDKRAVGALFIATSATGWATNPRGWFLDPSVNVTTAAGIAAFQARVLAYADTSIAYLKSMNAQGMVTWDIEGEQFPHATTYACDPRQLAKLAPEMDGVADAYFKKFRDAGFRVGVCIRPQDLVVAPDLSSAVQNEVADPAALMIAKMQYAQTRWGATIFYVDSNGGPNDPLDPAIFQRVAAALPNSVIFPEHHNLKYYAYTAPGIGLRDGYALTDASVKTIYPNAFSFVYTADGPITLRYNDLVTGVKQGDILLYRSWFDDQPANSQIKAIYQAAGTTAPPPTISITSPTNGSTVSGTVSISALPSASAGVAGVQFKVDGTSYGGEVTSAPYTIAWITQGVANGTHSLTALVRDATGATVTSAAVTVTLSNTAPAPTVQIVAPSSVSGTFTVSATASSSIGIAGVQFKVDGGNLGSEVSLQPYQTSVNSTLLSNGPHALSAVARDTANTTSTSSTTVTVNNVALDTTPPTVTLTAPAPSTTVAGTITVSANASDNVAVVGVQFKLDGANLGAEVTAAPYNVSWNTTTGSDGVHSLSATARDAAGNKANSASVSVTVTNTVAPPPTLSCNTPGTGAFQACYYTDTSWGKLAVVRTESAINYDWSFTGTPDPLIPHNNFSARWQGNFTFNSGDYTFTLGTDDGSLLYIDGQLVLNYWGEHPAIPVTGTKTLTAGTHLVRLDYYQLSARASASLAWVQVGSPTPPSAPAVSIVTPAQGATVSGTITVSANVSDVVGVASTQFLVDGNSIGFGSGSPYAVSLNTATLGNATHTLTALAKNAGGLSTTSAPVSFTANNTAAKPPSVSLSAGSLSTVAGIITLTATATDALGIASVQFQMDGVAIGNPLNVAPYILPFDTTAVANGAHAFTAVARNTSGLTTTSAPLTLTINNLAPPVPTCSTVGTNVFFGCYFGSMNWTNLVFTRSDEQIAFNWGWAGPGGGISPEYFSVRWQGNFTFAAGTYVFSAGTDDGSQIYVDGVMVLNNWGQHPAIPLTTKVALTAGTHLVRVDYYNQGGQGQAYVNWK